jgi:putative heme-binding domain-containing protein
LPDGQALPVLRGLWDRAGLDDAVLAVLARRPEAADRDKFVQALESPQLATVRLALGALEKLPPKHDAETATALVLALARLPDGKEEERTRTTLARYLQKVTGVMGPGTERDAWVEWLKKAHPAQAARLADADGVDAAAWSKRLAGVDWDKGDPQRGKDVYVRASCAACHSGAQALGPDLAGVAGRFSRADLFTAIVRPSKDVSARYRTTVVVTRDDKVYQGVIVYEAVDSVLLQTGPATTARIADSQVAEKRVTPRSLMPAGLLDRLADCDLADLYAYLKGLRSP